MTDVLVQALLQIGTLAKSYPTSRQSVSWTKCPVKRFRAFAPARGLLLPGFPGLWSDWRFSKGIPFPPGRRLDGSQMLSAALLGLTWCIRCPQVGVWQGWYGNLPPVGDRFACSQYWAVVLLWGAVGARNGSRTCSRYRFLSSACGFPQGRPGRSHSFLHGLPKRSPLA